MPDRVEGPSLSRRTLFEVAAAGAIAGAVSPANAQAAGPMPAVPLTLVPCSLRINGHDHALDLDPRTTLLDALRDHIGLTGAKKGCDHGQCGACTVIVDGRRINSCLTLAVMHEGDAVTTIEGLAEDGRLHPMQAAFVRHDGFQCGYCTPGQICSSVAMLEEAARGMPSHVTANLEAKHTALTGDEIRERTSGNICRCAAYPNIVAAIRDVAGGRSL